VSESFETANESQEPLTRKKSELPNASEGCKKKPCKCAAMFAFREKRKMKRSPPSLVVCLVVCCCRPTNEVGWGFVSRVSSS